MALGLFQRMALKKFIKNYIKALPLDLTDPKSLGFSGAFIDMAMTYHFSKDLHHDPHKLLAVRWSASEQSQIFFAEFTGNQLSDISSLIKDASIKMNRAPTTPTIAPTSAE